MPPSKLTASGPLRLLGSRIDPVSFQEALERIRGFLSEPGAHHVITGNTLMLLDAQHDAELRAILEHAALVVPESSGVYWASRRIGRPLPGFIPGIDLMLALCALAAEHEKPIYLLGAKPGVAQEAAAYLQSLFPALKVAGNSHGYLSEADTTALVRHIHDLAPGFLFVGLSVPGQEKWIARHLDALGVSVVMGVGGSFDVFAGRLARAPQWMRRSGIEWSYRLIQEPWRWRRIIRLPLFAAKILFDKWIQTLLAVRKKG